MVATMVQQKNFPRSKQKVGTAAGDRGIGEFKSRIYPLEHKADDPWNTHSSSLCYIHYNTKQTIHGIHTGVGCANISKRFPAT